MGFSRQEHWSGSACPNHTLEVSSDLKLLRDYSRKLEDKAQSPVTQHTILHSAPVNKGKDARFISPLDLPDPGIKLRSSASKANALLSDGIAGLFFTNSTSYANILVASFFFSS